MKKLLITTLLLTALASSTAFYVFTSLPDFPTQLGLAIAIAILIPQVVAIWVLLSSLSLFKRELKVAYYLLALSILFLSLNQLQLPVSFFVTFDSIALAWFITGSTLMGSVLMYLSMYRFASLLTIKDRLWGSFWAATGFALFLGFASTFIPHIEYPLDEWLVDGIFGTYVVAGGFSVAAAMLAWKVRGRLAPSYRTAMSWLVVGAIALAFSAFHETIIRLLPVFNEESFAWYSVYGVSLWPLLLVSIVFLVAALSFKKLSQELAELPEEASYLDIVTYVAQLASDPKAIDPTLDKVRQITAKKAGSAELTVADKTALLDVYYQLEIYLTTSDPFLKITKEDIRARLPESFRQKLENRNLSAS